LQNLSKITSWARLDHETQIVETETRPIDEMLVCLETVWRPRRQDRDRIPGYERSKSTNHNARSTNSWNCSK